MVISWVEGKLLRNSGIATQPAGSSFVSRKLITSEVKSQWQCQIIDMSFG